MKIKISYLLTTLILSFAFSANAKLVPNKTRLNFSAADYFAPIEIDEDRSIWPGQLTLIPDDTATVEQIKSKMLETYWKNVFHCNGKAISVEKFRKTAFADGIVNPALIQKFTIEDGRMFMQQIRKTPEVNPYGLQIQQSTSEIVSLVPSRNGMGKIEVKYSRYFTPEEYQMIQVQETGEILLDVKYIYSFSDEYSICPDHSVPKMILVPLRALLLF